VREKKKGDAKNFKKLKTPVKTKSIAKKGEKIAIY